MMHTTTLPGLDPDIRHRTSRRFADRASPRRPCAVWLSPRPGRARSSAVARARNAAARSTPLRRSRRDADRYAVRGRSRRPPLVVRQPLPPQDPSRRGRARPQRADAAPQPDRTGRLRGQVGRARAADRRGQEPHRAAQCLRILPRPRRPTVRERNRLRLAAARRLDGQPPGADRGNDRQPRIHRRPPPRRAEVLAPSGPRIAFTGGMDCNDHRRIWDVLDKVRAKHPDMVLLHGGSPKGAERIAACWADHHKVPQVVFKPDWTRHANAAPFKRNDQMLEALPPVSSSSPAPASPPTSPTRPASKAFRCGASVGAAPPRRRYPCLKRRAMPISGAR